MAGRAGQQARSAIRYGIRKVSGVSFPLPPPIYRLPSRKPQRHTDWMEQRTTSWPRGYAIALAATAATVAARWLLWPVLKDAVPHQSFIPAVLIAAYYGGFLPGLLATLLGAFIAN